MMFQRPTFNELKDQGRSYLREKKYQEAKNFFSRCLNLIEKDDPQGGEKRIIAAALLITAKVENPEYDINTLINELFIENSLYNQLRCISHTPIENLPAEAQATVAYCFALRNGMNEFYSGFLHDLDIQFIQSYRERHCVEREIGALSGRLEHVREQHAREWAVQDHESPQVKSDTLKRLTVEWYEAHSFALRSIEQKAVVDKTISLQKLLPVLSAQEREWAEGELAKVAAEAAAAAAKAAAGTKCIIM